MKKYWFKAKRYGYGWCPSSWEGWLAVGGYILIFVIIMSRLGGISSANGIIYQITIPILFITAVLVIIAWLTGEKARWRWGH